MPRSFLRSCLVLVGLLTASATLVACSGQGSSASTPSPSVAVSSVAADTSASPSATASAKVTTASDLSAITVTGDKDAAPTVTGPWPWAITKTTVKVLSQGTGATVGDSAQVEVNYAGINGRTGQTFDSSFDRGQASTFSVDQVITGFKTGLVGQKVGSRVLIGIPPADGYGTEGATSAGIEGTDTLLFVVDIISASVDGPTGTAVTPKEGLPTVTDVNGVPQITVPKTEAPTSLEIQPIIQGNGEKVASGDTITVNYKAVDWATGKEVVSTYGGEPQSGLLSDLIQGWKDGLVDQTIGSRILLVVPPDQAYPNGNTSPSIAPGTTLVYVVDILFSQSGTAQ